MEPMKEQVINISVDDKQQSNQILLFCSANGVFLFRCTSTAVQLCALLLRVTPVNHHATEEVRDEFINCRIQSNMHFNLTIFVCLSAERDVKDVDRRRAEPQVVVSSGPVIMSSPQQ